MTKQDFTPDETGSMMETAPLTDRASYISVVEIVALLLKRKRIIAISAAALTGVAALAISFLPEAYKAQATILTPQQQQSSFAAFAGPAAGLMGSSMAAQLGLKNPADLYVGILKSRTIADAIIDRFDLRQVYGTKLRSAARTALGKHVSFESGRDSLIEVVVEDTNPIRAAEIANRYVKELHDQNSRLALSDAAQRRLFFEERLENEKAALAEAEVELKKTQEATGLIAPSGQAELLLRSGAELRAQIASHEVGLQSLRAFATEDNPQVQVAKGQIDALRRQVDQLETSVSNSPEISRRKLPGASLEVIRKARDYKYHETLFELLAKQYEASRIDEAKQAPVIQVVDTATPPDRSSGPAKGMLVIASVPLAFILSCFLTLVSISVAKISAQYRRAQRSLELVSIG